MSEYTKAVHNGGESVAIRKDGAIMTINQVLEELQFAQIGRIACDNQDLPIPFILDAIQATKEMDNGDVEEYIRGWRCS